MKLFYKKKGLTLSLFIERRITAMKEQRLLFRGYPYSESAIASWEKFGRLWGDYCSTVKKEKKISALRLEDLNNLLNYCDTRRYRDSTRSLIVALFKAAMSAAYRDGILESPLRGLQDYSVTVKEITEAKKVYLNEDEILRIASLELPPGSGLVRSRDVFLVGCWTGQRFSDYCRLSSEDILSFKVNGQLRFAFRLRQKKTGAEVYIPILYPEVMEILARWNGRLPAVKASSLNHDIKLICRMAGIGETVKIEERIGGRQVTSIAPKCNLVSSHTARRSFITNLYLEGRLTEMQIRSISGHRSAMAFRRYICCSSKDNLMGIFESWTVGRNGSVTNPNFYHKAGFSGSVEVVSENRLARNVKENSNKEQKKKISKIDAKYIKSILTPINKFSH